MYTSIVSNNSNTQFLIFNYMYAIIVIISKICPFFSSVTVLLLFDNDAVFQCYDSSILRITFCVRH